jgi:hypothetical protein
MKLSQSCQSYKYFSNWVPLLLNGGSRFLVFRSSLVASLELALRTSEVHLFPHLQTAAWCVQRSPSADRRAAPFGIEETTNQVWPVRLPLIPEMLMQGNNKNKKSLLLRAGTTW